MSFELCRKRGIQIKAADVEKVVQAKRRFWLRVLRKVLRKEDKSTHTVMHTLTHLHTEVVVCRFLYWPSEGGGGGDTGGCMSVDEHTICRFDHSKSQVSFLSVSDYNNATTM